jgi:hypothetical protein
MNTIRNRRVLSAHRHLGAQGSPDALAGRAQRHAQGWRDQQPDDGLGAIRGVVRGAAVVATIVGIAWGIGVGGVIVVDYVLPTIVTAVATR